MRKGCNLLDHNACSSPGTLAKKSSNSWRDCKCNEISMRDSFAPTAPERTLASYFSPTPANFAGPFSHSSISVNASLLHPNFTSAVHLATTRAQSAPPLSLIAPFRESLTQPTYIEFWRDLLSKFSPRLFIPLEDQLALGRAIRTSFPLKPQLDTPTSIVALLCPLTPPLKPHSPLMFLNPCCFSCYFFLPFSHTSCP